MGALIVTTWMWTKKMMNFSTMSIQSYLRDDFPVANYNCAHPDGFIMVYLKWGNPFFSMVYHLNGPYEDCHVLPHIAHGHKLDSSLIFGHTQIHDLLKKTHI